MVARFVKPPLQVLAWAAWLLGLLPVQLGCGSDVLVSTTEQPVEPRCHTGYEMVDGVCQIKEIYFTGGQPGRKVESWPGWNDRGRDSCRLMWGRVA